MNPEKAWLYFDHCASTPPHPDVVRTLAEVMQRHYGNPSSLHRAGLDADRLIRQARELLGKLFEVEADEWIFTSGGTESNQLAIKGAARANRSKGSHLITSVTEHASVLEAFLQLEREGFEVTYLPVDSIGRISVEQLRDAMKPGTILVSLMQVNNETGAVQPIAEAGSLLRGCPDTLFHVDGVQSIGKLPVRLREWGIDLFSGSAHKLRGPKGSGFLYVRGGVRLEPLLGGGEQESGFRPGTQNVPGIVASAKAVRLSMESREERARKLGGLRSRLLDRIALLPELEVNGDSAPDSPYQAPHVLNFSYAGMKPEVLVHALEEAGMLVSTKSACSSKDDKPSGVLLAMGYPRHRAAAGIRVSFGDEHGPEDIDRLADALAEAVRRLKPLERNGR
ncbi:cysteine desulfurase family protein [Paenibacillus humicus]|uniref:cysteine desulfurase family protein n=1 Tax=Paenibacillus humicus TaxID=412861 RepID=UPI000FD75042|nr:cysteine desulfurase family protein [Paenibacillus humicus]